MTATTEAIHKGFPRKKITTPAIMVVTTRNFTASPIIYQHTDLHGRFMFQPQGSRISFTTEER